MIKASRYKVAVSALIVEERTTSSEWGTIEVTGEGATRHQKNGFLPEHTKRIEQERQIYEQTVDELDMAALVSVVNGIER